MEESSCAESCTRWWPRSRSSSRSLLNNELTDFNVDPTSGASAPGANQIAGRKRPRCSIAPTIVLRGDRPVLAVGSPGGASIITTVLQILVNRLDLGLSLPEAIAAPRLSQRNAATTQSEAAPLQRPSGARGSRPGAQADDRPAVRAAHRRGQAVPDRLGLTVDGIVGAETWAMLGS